MRYQNLRIGKFGYRLWLPVLLILIGGDNYFGVNYFKERSHREQCYQEYGRRDIPEDLMQACIKYFKMQESWEKSKQIHQETFEDLKKDGDKSEEIKELQEGLKSPGIK